MNDTLREKIKTIPEYCSRNSNSFFAHKIPDI